MHNPAGLSAIVAGAWRLAEWQWTPQERLAWIEANLDIGVTSFDHADIYGGYSVEALFGEALALRPSLRARGGGEDCACEAGRSNAAPPRKSSSFGGISRRKREGEPKVCCP